MSTLSKTERDQASNFMPRLGRAFFKERGAIPASLREGLEAGALAPRHVQALNMIAIAGRLSVGALALSLQVGLPAASQIATELEKNKWLVRQYDENDQRRVWLSVAEDRRDEIATYCRKRVEPLLRVLAAMPSRDRKKFLDGLGSLLEEIELNGR